MTVLRSPLRPVLRSPLYSPLVGKWGGAFSPSDLFQSGDILLWYDPSDLSTMFQDTAGVTPVTADGQSVALHLDKGQWGGKTYAQMLAAQTELITNGDFASSTGWTVPAGWTISGGKANASAVALADFLTRAVTITAGKTYRVEYTISGYSSGAVSVVFDGATDQTGTAYSANGTYVEIILATVSASLAGVRARGSAFTGAVDNFSIKEIPGYSRIQATGTSMPKYKTDGALHWLLYDGTDDGLATGTITWGTDEVAVCAGITKASDAATGAFIELSTTKNSNNGVFAIFAPVAPATAQISWYSKGTTERGVAVSTAAAPVTSIITCIGDISGDVSSISRDGGAAVTTNLDQGTGNFGSYPLYFGRRGGATLPFKGREHQTVIRSRLLSAAELSSLETYVAAKTGVIL